jgi:hypothetical protein
MRLETCVTIPTVGDMWIELLHKIAGVIQNTLKINFSQLINFIQVIEI